MIKTKKKVKKENMRTNEEKINYINELLNDYILQLPSDCILDICFSGSFYLLMLILIKDINNNEKINEIILDYLRLNTYYINDDVNDLIAEIIVTFLIIIITIGLMYYFNTSSSSDIDDTTTTNNITTNDILNKESLYDMISLLDENFFYNFYRDDGTIVRVSINTMHEVLTSAELDLFITSYLSIN